MLLLQRYWFYLFGSAALGVSATPVQDSSKEYDYVIVGGGTAGLVMANRLTEDPQVTVAVIEPGGDQRNNINVTSPYLFGTAFGTSIDWHYPVQPQVFDGNTIQLYYLAGKAIGGTTTINGMTYIRPTIANVDAWQDLGNDGWNWKNLWPYFLKQEAFQPPNKAQRELAGANYNPAFHNYDGPVAVGWETGLRNGTMFSVQKQTWQNFGYKYNPDLNGGNELGFTVWPKMVNRTLDRRCDAATAYFWPFMNRPNLHLIQGFANKIIWADTSKGADAIAKGVEYTSPNGKTQTLTACKEVHIAAGAMRTPLILEHSGIGNPSILTRYGIQTVVSNAGVGEHLQDQTNVANLYSSANASANGTMPYVTFATMSDIYGSNVSSVADQTKASIPAWAKQASAVGNGSVSAAAWEAIFKNQWELLFVKGVPAAEILNTEVPSGPSLITVEWPLLPFSRGNVHIGSSDPSANPVININYFTNDYDVDLQIAMSRLTRRFYATQPLKQIVGDEVSPTLAAVPKDAPDSVWKKWLTANFSPNYHAVGTAAMLPRKLGGVVDSKLRVYGTKNVRVLDASVLPTQMTSHLTAVVYAVAERAADIVKGKI